MQGNNAMNRKLVVGVACLLAAILVGVATTASAQQAAPVIPLTANGEKLLVHYAEMLKALQAEIGTSLPTINAPQKTAFLKAYQAEKEAVSAELNAMRAQCGKGV